MGLLSIEHSKVAYSADFVAYGVGIVATAGVLAFKAPAGQHGALLLTAGAGLLVWTLIEYLIHRFVFHGLAPFKHWHADHHQRPSALLGTPTLGSAALMALLVTLPCWLLTGSVWSTAAFTAGVSLGYLAYGLMHHGMHHWRSDLSWWKQRKLWHARHHHVADRAGHYGLTTSFWDHVFGTARSGR